MKLAHLLAHSTMLLGLLGATSPALAQTARVPVEAYAELPQLKFPILSPDGKSLAVGMNADNGDPVVMIMNMDTQVRNFVSLGKNSLSDIVFDDDGTVIVEANDTIDYYGTNYELFRYFSLDKGTTRARMLVNTPDTPRAFNTGSEIVGMLPNDPGAILMQTRDTNNANQAVLNLYRVVLNSTELGLVERGNTYTYDWLADETGRALVRADHNPERKVTKLFGRDGAGWRELLVIEDTGTPGVTVRGFDRRGRVLFSRLTDEDGGILEALDLTTAAISVAVRPSDAILNGSITNPWTQKLEGVALGGLEPGIVWTTAPLNAIRETLEATFAGQDVDIVSRSRDDSVVLASIAPRGAPPVLYKFEPVTNRVTRLGATMPSLDGKPFGTISARTYAARDGFEVPVYITFPPGYQTTSNAPAIMMPHGGPESRDYPGFDWWAGFMASRGYVVIQPQFRGSSGFGRAHSKAGYRQWGRLMQHDVTDAVAWAAKEGLIDPKRVCIVGASYGGYAALAGATLTPNVYRCAVSVAGVSDLELMIRQERSLADGRSSRSVNYWVDHIGADDREAMRAHSPRRLASRVTAPVLLMHGKDDTVVLPEQSKVMLDALRDAGKSVRYVELKDEDHWLSRAPTRLQMLRELEAFLAEHLGPGLSPQPVPR
jgi:dipeptidyl aminopeptidase/acylaminoacyl peptidase